MSGRAERRKMGTARSSIDNLDLDPVLCARSSIDNLDLDPVLCALGF